MIHSMTGYARQEIKGPWGNAVWEIRSVNQRYLETYIRTPEQFRGLEPLLRERFRHALARGKVECNLRFEANPAANCELKINEDLAKQVIHAARHIKQSLTNRTTSERAFAAGLLVWEWPITSIP